MLNSRHLKSLQSLQRHIPGPAVLAAANCIIACSVPKRSLRSAEPDADSQAGLHTLSDARQQGAERGATHQAPRQPSAASLAHWHRQPSFHTSSAALLAGGPQGGEGRPPTGVNGAAVVTGGSDEGVGEGTGEGAEEVVEDAAAEHIQKAFEDLIQAAYELVQEGKPMEAEYVLREGAKSAEAILGKDCIEVAPLYDQLAMISFFHDRIEEAKEPALKAFSILMEQEGEDSPATAIAGMRYAILLLAGGNPEEALKYFNVSIASLEAAIDFLKGVEDQGDEEDMQNVALATAKFEVGLGESLYYKALAELALGPKDEESIKKHEEGMLRGIRLLLSNLGKEQPLVGAALREHHRLVEQALEGDDFAAAEALYVQQLRLHEAYDPESEHVAMLGYQIGTLQYVMGKYTEAAATLERSLSIVRNNFEDVEEYLLTVKHRLGMAYGALGQHDKARAALEEVRAPLAEKLAEDNPITHELDFMLALMAHQEAAGDAARQAEFVQEMEANLAKLSSYGEEHMLVKAAQEQLDRAKTRQ